MLIGIFAWFYGDFGGFITPIISFLLKIAQFLFVTIQPQPRIVSEIMEACFTYYSGLWLNCYFILSFFSQTFDKSITISYNDITKYKGGKTNEGTKQDTA